MVSPMLLHRYEEFGDPLYFSQSSTIFSGNPVAIVDNLQNIEYSASDYIDENGITAPSGAGMTLNNFDTDGGVIS